MNRRAEDSITEDSSFEPTPTSIRRSWFLGGAALRFVLVRVDDEARETVEAETFSRLAEAASRARELAKHYGERCEIRDLEGRARYSIRWSGADWEGGWLSR